MQRFFFDDETIINNAFEVTGDKHNHIVRVLRMSVGEKAVFCDKCGTDYECELVSATKDKAEFKVITSYENSTEPSLKITLFQCMPKGEKLDEAVKRCVQFGVTKITPVISRRCVARPDKKSLAKKVERLNKISLSSAMQCMRGIVPKVTDAVDFKTAIYLMGEYDNAFVCYEDEQNLLINKLEIKGSTLAILIGPEGGIDESEASYAIENGVKCLSLGKRILRTEDAGAFSIPIFLSMTDNL